MNIVSNTGSFAAKELAILSASATDPDDRPIIEEFSAEIIALCEKFGNSGQSGGSAPYTAGAIAEAVKSLCLHRPIAPLTGENDEWNDISSISPMPSFQNKRCSAVFKDAKDGKAYYVDAIVWRDQSGHTWTGPASLASGEEYRSSQTIRSFPFKPKTFYVDVFSEKVSPDDWINYVKDERQLDEAREYYDVSPVRTPW